MRTSQNLKLRAKYGHFTWGEASGRGNHGHFMPVFLKHAMLRSWYKLYVSYVAHLLSHVSVHIILWIEGTKCPRSLWGIVLVPVYNSVIFNWRSDKSLRALWTEKRAPSLSLALFVNSIDIIEWSIIVNHLPNPVANQYPELRTSAPLTLPASSPSPLGGGYNWNYQPHLICRWQPHWAAPLLYLPLRMDAHVRVQKQFMPSPGSPIAQCHSSHCHLSSTSHTHHHHSNGFGYHQVPATYLPPPP